MRLYRLIAIVTLLSVLLAACSAETSPSPVASNAPASDSATTSDSSTPQASVEYTYAGETPAPDFPVGLEWLNVDRPLSIAQDLRGKIVLLDFWTLGCINCIHIIPDLKRLEAEFPDSLVVIGVHSAKFETEGQLESIRQAVLRYGIEHPVVNDNQQEAFYNFGANAWPYTFLIDPLGNAVGRYSGEGVYQVMQPVIATMDEEFRASGVIDTRSLELVLEENKSAPTVLSFPGKVLADERGDRLFIADSNHNRVLVSDLEGALQIAIGSGFTGFDDGDFASATFNRPQGMALSADGNTLYIADLENHAVRAADLANQTVSTIAGTGFQALAYPSGAAGLDTALSSPWDLLLNGDTLYVAMSGVHQLWQIDLANDNRVEVFAGSGREGIDDGHPSLASLSQPSGFTTDGKLLYFTDPESSAIRSIPLDGSGEIKTIIGTGLFDFGDIDGTYPNALLQHALGIAYYDGQLYVADTYNHKIKIIDPALRTSRTWIGDGQIGWVDGNGSQAELAEPSGLSIANGKLYVADTNNHLIRIADLNSGELSTLTLSNLQVARMASQADQFVQHVTLEPHTVSAGAGAIEFDFDVPENYQFNDLGPFTLTWSADDDSIIKFEGEGEPIYREAGPDFPVAFRVQFSPGETTLHAQATVFYCEFGDEELCLVRDVALDIPIVVSATASNHQLEIKHTMPEREG